MEQPIRTQKTKSHLNLRGGALEAGQRGLHVEVGGAFRLLPLWDFEGGRHPKTQRHVSDRAAGGLRDGDDNIWMG